MRTPAATKEALKATDDELYRLRMFEKYDGLVKEATDAVARYRAGIQKRERAIKQVERVLAEANKLSEGLQSERMAPHGDGFATLNVACVKAQIEALLPGARTRLQRELVTARETLAKAEETLASAQVELKKYA